MAAFCFLNVFMNARYPERQAWHQPFLPSLDVVALLVVFACSGSWHWHVPRWLRWSLVALLLLLFARVLRFADGVEQGAYVRDFVLALDLPLLPEFARLFYGTLSAPSSCWWCSA